MQDIEAQPPQGGGGTAGTDTEAPGGALAQSSGLLREVDHRVKNNLQLIASLIQLQIRRAEDDAARQALQTVLERLNAVATVHRRLFQGDPLTFQVAEFIRDLAPDLAAAAGREDLTISLDLDPVQIPTAAAAPLALVINELIGNALKHAFAMGRPGRISVTLRAEDLAYILTITDDGVGLQDRPAGLGLTIVRLLCQQLHAALDIGESPSGGGVRVVVRAPFSRMVAS